MPYFDLIKLLDPTLLTFVTDNAVANNGGLFVPFSKSIAINTRSSSVGRPFTGSAPPVFKQGSPDHELKDHVAFLQELILTSGADHPLWLYLNEGATKEMWKNTDNVPLSLTPEPVWQSLLVGLLWMHHQEDKAIPSGEVHVSLQEDQQDIE